MATGDDIFPNTPPANPGADPGAAGASPAIDPAALRDALSAALEQHVAPLNKHISDLNQRIEQLSNPPKAGEPPKKGAGGEGEDDALTTFMEDPEAMIERVAKRTIAHTVVPAIKLGLNQTSQDIIQAHKGQIDREFGQGTWDELFDKAITDTIKDLPLEMQASRPHLLRAVSARYGELHMDPALRVKLQEKRDEAGKAMETPTMLSGYGRPKPTTEDISPDEKQFLSALEASGFPVSKDSYLTARKLGGSESAWAAHLSKKRGSQGKTT